MSKIGDLFVRLGLKKDEFSRGMKEAGNESRSFANIVRGIGGSAKMAFAAISAAVIGVVAAIKDLSKQNQVLADTVGRFTSGMSAMFDTLKTSIASLDFSDIITNLREANRLARELYDAQDAMGEIGTAYNISLAKQLKHINELKVKLHDVNLSEKERIAAGNELLQIYEKLEQNPTRGLKRVKDTSLDYYMQRMGVSFDGRSDKEMAAIRNKYVSFFEWLGTKEGETYLAAAEKVNKRGGVSGALGQRMISNAAYKGMGEYARLAIQYSAKIGEKDREKIQNAVVGYYSQVAKFSGETRRIQTLINSVTAKQNGGGGGKVDDLLGKMERSLIQATDRIETLTDRELEDLDEELSNTKPIKFEPIEVVPPDMDGIMEAFDRFKAYAIDWDRLAADFRENVVSGFSAGMQELTDQLFGLQDVNPGKIVQALLTPLADMATKEGELLMLQGAGIKAAKIGLTSMQPGAMIAAGAALVAAGAAIKSGLAAIANAGSATSSTSTYQGGSSSLGNQNITTELTVTVKGELRGRDIVLAGQNTLNSWGR